jgi:NADPH-dependent glutamate synthase beta subunit-like oxidoreductase
MRYGIPSYRLARSVLDAEIERIVALGVDVRCGASLSTHEDLERLRGEFDAVYFATGAQRTKRLPQLDYAQPWVIDGAEYLARSNAGAPPALGKHVVVIGGGSAAFDAARSARRAGHEVTILALEARSQLPAQREEVVEAIEEGVALVDGAMLTGAREADAGLRLDCIRVRFAPGTQRDRFTVTPIAGSEFSLAAGAIVSSIGQDPDLAPLPVLESSGALLKVDARQATSAQRIYAGGDLASMARFVTEAIGMGKRAALEIDRVLRRSPADVPTVEPQVALAAINTYYYPKGRRAAQARLDAAQRLACASEVQLGLEIEQALGESERCFSCGTCIFCDNCVDYCPDLAVKRNGAGYAVLGDYCKGCGLCVRECPTGSMKMVEEAR